MVNVVGSRDDYGRWKPDGLKDHFTMAELCARVGRDSSRIRQLEKSGQIAAPIRVQVGMLRVRLYSPKEVRKIEEHFKNARPGNPNFRRKKNSKRKAVS
jgi:hypothetical protein